MDEVGRVHASNNEKPLLQHTAAIPPQPLPLHPLSLLLLLLNHQCKAATAAAATYMGCYH